MSYGQKGYWIFKIQLMLLTYVFLAALILNDIQVYSRSTVEPFLASIFIVFIAMVLLVISYFFILFVNISINIFKFMFKKELIIPAVFNDFYYKPFLLELLFGILIIIVSIIGFLVAPHSSGWFNF